MPPSHKDILRRTVDALEASLKRYPENEKILHQLALAYAQLGRFDPDATKVYQRAADLFPNDVKVQRALSIGYIIQQSSTLMQDVKEMASVDTEALQRGVERLLRITREYPDSPYVHRAMGDLLLIQGEERDAIQHYRCAMALGMTELEPLCNHFEQVRRLRDLSGHVGVFFAEIYQRLNLVEKANQVFQDFLDMHHPERIVLDKYDEFLQWRVDSVDPTEEETLAKSLRLLIRVKMLKGNISEALTWARQMAPEHLVKDARLAKDLARRLILMEDFRQAFEYLSRIPLDEETKGLLNEIAVLLEKRGELDTAVYILQFINDNDEIARESKELIQRKRKRTRSEELQIEMDTELQLAELHWKSRRWDQALEAYLHVLELGYEDYRSLLEPLDAVLARVAEVSQKQLVFLANFFAERREWRRVLHYTRSILAVTPDHPAMSQRLLQACDRILLENPDDNDVRLLHGDEQMRLGNLERAMQEFRRCAEVPEYKMKANRRLAKANFRAGDLISAFERYKALPVLEVEDLEQVYDLSVAFANQQRHKEAFEAVKLIREYDETFRDVREKCIEYEQQMNQQNVGFFIDPKMRELIGDHSIGRYKYIGKIGSGGMGVVHKVLDLKTNTVVAMKILREGLSSSGKAIDRFFREARIAATLHHKNIVNILDYNISNNYGQSYIAMEFVDGPAFREIIERKFAETVDLTREYVLQVLDWTSQLCDALEATHKKGIIHRDIKPDNVMLAPGDVVKITDFGIVHIEEATFTPTGALIGTPRYMSPEQVHGGRIDMRSDIYAVGIIMYELLIGSPPFISGDISYQQVNVLPTPPKEICPTVPASVDKVIMQCLEKAPVDRYQNAAELKKDVDEAFIRLGGDPSRRKPSTAGLRTPTPVRVPFAERPDPLRAPLPLRPAAPTTPDHAIPPVPVTVAPKSTREASSEENIETPAPDVDARVANATRELDSELDLGSRQEIDPDLDVH